MRWPAHRSVDPGPGESDQPGAAVGVEAVHRSDQRRGAVLHGIVEVLRPHATAQGVQYHPAQSGLDQHAACTWITLPAADEKLPLLLGGQRGSFERAAGVGRHVHTVPAIG
ncbi:hypothetical protein AWX17_27555 [Priestia megaterium]|nr:hypothetical protein AWX17_27555 [Priestia megaterium]